MPNKKDAVIYQAKSGAIELRGDFSKETIWATQTQIATAFDIDIRTVNEHIQNIFKTSELSEKATLRNFRIVQTEGKREIEREVKHYNLDLILSVGYRVNSKRATLFRQWATKTLRSHIVNGYTINKSRIKYNYDAFLRSVSDIQALLPDNNVVDARNILDLVREFASTWLSLDAYDRDTLTVSGATKKSITLTGQELTDAITELRTALIKKGEATHIFAQEKHAGSIAGIVGNVMQSFGGKAIYPSLEEKAAHLLYFIVKDHPFTDGNKRSGAFAFIWFLRRAKLLDTSRITPQALTALTLLVAESNPKDKNRLIGLILLLLKK